MNVHVLAEGKSQIGIASSKWAQIAPLSLLPSRQCSFWAVPVGTTGTGRSAIALSACVAPVHR